MANSISLNFEQHGVLKHDLTGVVNIFAQQQSIELRITEVVQAANNYPLFLLRDGQNRVWQPTALLGLAEGSNLFVQDGQWTGVYRPQLLDLYPFFLIPNEDRSGYKMGLDEQSSALSHTQGEALYDTSGQPSTYLNNLQRRLQADLKDGAPSYAFTDTLDKLNLLRPVDLSVEFEGSGQHLVSGLHTINEEALNTLDAESLVQLQQKGYLAPLYALLVSIYQINAMIRRHNHLHGDKPVKRINLETKKA